LRPIRHLARFFFITFTILLTSCQSAFEVIKTPLFETASFSPQAILDTPSPVHTSITTTTPTTTETNKTQQSSTQAAATISSTPTFVVMETVIPNELLYCKQEGCIYTFHPIFGRPIPVGFNQEIESHYRYGTTQFGKREVHNGVEFINPTGTPVIASEGGIVEFAGNDFSQKQDSLLGFYGNLIILRHHIPGRIDPFFTLYAHLSKIDVKTGDLVERGQFIGEVGRTGSAIGSHLHFEVRMGRNTSSASTNPELWLEPTADQENENNLGVLVARMNDEEISAYSLEIVIQEYSDPTATTHKTEYAETYAYGAKSDPFWSENLVLSDLIPGIYRISFTRLDRSYQKFIEIEPGLITLVEFEIDY
jgi:murein DD-endopeptidase MepM/ murein hydrolase activator NlpD